MRARQFCIVCLGVLWLHGSAWAAARDSFITSSLSASFFATEGDFDPGKTFGNDGYLRVYEGSSIGNLYLGWHGAVHHFKGETAGNMSVATLGPTTIGMVLHDPNPFMIAHGQLAVGSGGA